MKYAFIINPIAGNGKRRRSSVQRNCSGARFEFDIELHYGDRPGSATHIADKVAASAERDEEVRIYACGGDGIK